MRKLLLASGNPGKLEEMRALLDGLHLERVTPQESDLKQDVHESGESYAENAAIKAMVFSNATGMVTLADDSGLEVDALGGLPGIRSARFFSPAWRFGRRPAGLFAGTFKRLAAPVARSFSLYGRPGVSREEIRFVEGDCQGEIIPQERVRTALDMIRSS